MAEQSAQKTELKYVRFSVGEGWSALYVDGQLDMIGDSHNVTEHIEELLGVAYQESEVMEAIRYRDEAPATLAALRALEDELRDRQQAAESLRRQAAELVAQADALLAQPK